MSVSELFQWRFKVYQRRQSKESFQAHLREETHDLLCISPFGSIMGWLFSLRAVPLMVQTSLLWLQWAEGREWARVFSCGSQT